jgi:uncharacterized membrane protein YeaQ/YmgE (transglycosylase-associated protein family)
MSFIAWIVVGAIAGFIATRVTNASGGLLMTVGLGIVGGLVGGWFAANVLKMGSVDGLNIESIVIATLGAVAVVWIANAASGKGTLRRRAG